MPSLFLYRNEEEGPQPVNTDAPPSIRIDLLGHGLVKVEGAIAAIAKAAAK
jgi:hypothetical protein